MTKYLLPILMLIFACPLSAQQDSEAGMSLSGVPIRGEVMVQFPKGFVHTESELFRADPLGLDAGEQLSRPSNIWLFRFDHSQQTNQSMIRALYDLGIDGLLAQENTYVELRAITPNDPLFANQWHHTKIESADAWDTTTGGTTDSDDDIVVCIIESANVMGHPDLAANHWTNTAEVHDGTDTDGNGYIDDVNGWNVNTQTDNIGSGGHGTSVAGMIGAVGDNGIGVAGANWDVKMMVVAGHNQPFTQANIVAAYTYPLEARLLWNSTEGQEGAFVVATNASWGVDGADPNSYPIWCNFYDDLGAAGILNCGATTNNNWNVDQTGDVPTACASDYMVSVTATTSSDAVPTGYGVETIDVAAPGIGVWTTTNGGTGYGMASGTSFASPLTAGVIGLMYSIPCEDFMALVKAYPQEAADAVREALYDGVTQTPYLQTRVRTGGHINAHNAIDILMDRACNMNTADVGVDSILSPQEDDEDLTHEEEITVLLRNYGNTPQGNFDVSYTINEGAVVTETFTGTINPLGTAAFSFATTADFSVDGTYILTVYTDLIGDEDPANDPQTIEIEVETIGLGSHNMQGQGLTVLSLGNNRFEAYWETAQTADAPTIIVYNLLGQSVYQATPVYENGRYTHTFEINSLQAGVYMVKADAAGQSEVARILVR